MLWPCGRSGFPGHGHSRPSCASRSGDPHFAGLLDLAGCECGDLRRPGTVCHPNKTIAWTIAGRCGNVASTVSQDTGSFGLVLLAAAARHQRFDCPDEPGRLGSARKTAHRKNRLSRITRALIVFLASPCRSTCSASTRSCKGRNRHRHRAEILAHWPDRLTQIVDLPADP